MIVPLRVENEVSSVRSETHYHSMNELSLFFVKRLKFGVSKRFQNAANEPRLVVDELPGLIVEHFSLVWFCVKSGKTSGLFRAIATLGPNPKDVEAHILPR